MQPASSISIYPSYQTREPCEYFSNGKPSPTFNRKSHDRWGARHVRALDNLHEYAPPSHWATIKFNRHETTAKIKAFSASLARAVAYYNRSRHDHLAMFGALHIEGDCTVHAHILIRATVAEPHLFLQKMVQKYNRKHGTIISVPYCERPQCTGKVTHYLFKLGSKSKNLFTRNLGLRFVFQCGRYFLGRPKAEYEREQRQDYVLRKYEAKVDAVLCNAEDVANIDPEAVKVAGGANVGPAPVKPPSGQNIYLPKKAVVDVVGRYCNSRGPPASR